MLTAEKLETDQLKMCAENCHPEIAGKIAEEIQHREKNMHAENCHPEIAGKIAEEIQHREKKMHAENCHPEIAGKIRGLKSNLRDLLFRTFRKFRLVQG